MSSDRLRGLQHRLDAVANPKTRDWWERYLKHVIPFRGVKMAGIRRSLHDWLESESVIVHLTPEAQVDIPLEMLRQQYAEDKLAGILMLQEILIPTGVVDWRRDLPRFASLFDDGFIYDWNTCDWFCVKALDALPGETPIIYGNAVRQALPSSISQSTAMPTLTASLT